MPIASGRRLWGVLLILSLALVIGGSVLWAGGGFVREGDSLAHTAELRWDFGELPPGQEVVLMLSGVQNTSEDPLTITNISPIGRRGEAGVAELVSIELAPRVGDDRDVAEGPFVIYPPGESVGRGLDAPCTLVEVFSPAGYELSPRGSARDDASFVARFRALAVGDVAIKLAEVEYEKNGLRYKETIPLIARFHVREEAKPMSDFRSEGCLDEAEALSPYLE